MRLCELNGVVPCRPSKVRLGIRCEYSAPATCLLFLKCSRTSGWTMYTSEAVRDKIETKCVFEGLRSSIRQEHFGDPGVRVVGRAKARIAWSS